MHLVKLFDTSSHTAFSGLFGRLALRLQLRYRVHKLLAFSRASNERMLVGIEDVFMYVRVYMSI